MAMNDSIADLLTRIRNAKAAKHRYVDVDLSKMRLSILKILKEKGFVESFLQNDEKRMVRIFLKYSKSRRSIIQDIIRVSTPGLRKYISSDRIPRIHNGLGIAILSTPQGVLDGETARRQNVGGEYLCKVW